MSATVPASVHADTAVNRDTLLRRFLTPTPVFELAGPRDDGRAEAEALVAEKFQSAWQARVTHFLPWLMSMHCLGHCSAVAGIRPAAGSALYLEQYLDQPVEQLLSAVLGTQVQRRELAEIGNLAASQRGASHLLFLVMTVALHRAGFKWMVFTATQGLRNNLDKLGFPLHTLTAADPARLPPAEQAEWGKYYDSEPLVMAGSLEQALQLIGERPLLRRVLRLYRYQINLLAETLKGV
jgi:hypothetical protein